MVVYEDGWFYAFFGTGTYRTDGLPSVANHIDVYRFRDGLRFECIAENTCPIPTAVAGYCFHKIGEWWYYYPTCIDSEKGVHFKIYRTRDFLVWEHLGDEHDSLPDRRIYRERWDELCILEDADENGAPHKQKKVHSGQSLPLWTFLPLQAVSGTSEPLASAVFLPLFADPLAGGTADLFPEHLGKIQRIAVPAGKCDLRNGLPALADQPQRTLDAQVIDVLGKADLHILLEQRRQIFFRIRIEKDIYRLTIAAKPQR